jgi:hypothetical protein
MSLKFQKLEVKSRQELEPYFKLRELISCEYNFNVMLLWSRHNQTQYSAHENYLILSQINGGKFITLMPVCKEEHFKEAFEDVWSYFKENNLKLRMFVADKKFADFIKNNYGDLFSIQDNRDYADYIYEAEKLRTLKGKKYSKKRNHLNAFYAEYEGRYYYKKLQAQDKDDVCRFLRGWKRHKEEITSALDSELDAICRVIDHLDVLDIKCGAIYVDDRLEALSIGSLVNDGKEAVIHVEKANDSIRGLYPLINQVFLLNEFPEVEIVNREEDLGIPGLRKAKLSYHPSLILNKYFILEK